MIRNKYNWGRCVPLFFVFAIIAALLSSCSNTARSLPSPETIKKQAAYADTIKCKFYDEKSFRRSISHAAADKLGGTGIKGGISPHHLLADDLIAPLFKTVSMEQPDVVVVVAPNHKNVGDKKVSTCYSSWETPFGLLPVDVDLAKRLAVEKDAGVNKNLMQEEHSISALVPYIKYYMPDSKIVPILLHGDYSLDSSIELGKYIANLVNGKKYLILASVDFSHYLTGEEADKMDEITIKAVEKRDLKQIRGFTNDNMDSPPSIITLLSAMNALKADNLKVLAHSNSDKVTGTKVDETTSYFTMLFY